MPRLLHCKNGERRSVLLPPYLLPSRPPKAYPFVCVEGEFYPERWIPSLGEVYVVDQTENLD